MPVEQTELVLGRGEVFFDRFLPDSLSGEGERYIGNTTTFQISREIERLAVRRSYGGRIHEAKGAVLSEEVSVEMVTDHIATDNLMDWFGDPVLGRVSYGSDLTPVVRTFRVIRGRYYPLSPDGFSNFFYESAAFRVGSTNLVGGVDFEFDAMRGRVYIMPAAPRVSDGANVTATFFQRPSGVHVVAPDAAEVFGALRYVSHNIEGAETDYWFPMVRMAPRGSVDLKADEWQQIRFQVTALRRTPMQPLLFVSRPGSAPAAITADTTLVTADTTLVTADNGVWSFS